MKMSRKITFFILGVTSLCTLPSFASSNDGNELVISYESCEGYENDAEGGCGCGKKKKKNHSLLVYSGDTSNVPVWH
jgi:hypothetical protein